MGLLLAGSAFSQPIEASDPFRFAMQLYRDGMYVPAAEEFLSIAEVSPTREQADRARLWAARAFYGARDWQRTLATAQPLSVSPVDKSTACGALYLVGRTREELRQPTQALDAYATLVGLHPDCPQHAEAALRSGLMTLEMGQPARALAFFSRVDATAADSLRILAAVGRAGALARLDRTDEASEVLGEIDRFETAGNLCGVQLKVGRVYRKLGKLPDAASAFARAGVACADSTARLEAWVSLARVLGEQRDWRGAGKAHRDAAKLTDGDDAARELRLAAEAYARAERWDDVVETLGEAREAARELPTESVFTLARAYREQREYSAAVRAYLGAELGVAADSPTADEARWQAAQTYLAAGWYRLAANALERFRLYSPHHPRAPEALRLEGEISGERLKRTASAADLFTLLASEYPYASEAPEALLSAGQYWLALDRPNRAREAFEAVVREYPTSAAFESASGEVEKVDTYLVTNEERARERLEASVVGESVPDRVRADVEFEDLKDYRSAAVRYEALAGEDAPAEGRARALYGLGLCHWRISGDPRRALDDHARAEARRKAAAALRQVVEKYPESPWAAEAQWTVDRIDTEAYRAEEEQRLLYEIDLLNRYAQRYPGAHPVEVRFRLGRAYERLADLGAADHYLTAADAYAGVPEDSEWGARALVFSARSWLEAGKFDEAAERYDRLARMYRGRPLLAEILYRRAECLRRAQKEKAAAKVFGDLVEGAPASPWAMRAALRLGDLHRGSGELSAAVPYYERVVRMAPEAVLRAAADQSLAECLAGLGRREEALGRLDALISENEGRPVADRALLSRGAVLEGGGDLQAAAETYRTLIASNPSEDVETVVWARLGSALLRLGQNAEAADALRAARSRNLPPDGRAQVLAELATALYRADRGTEGDSVLVELRGAQAADTTLAKVALERGRHYTRTGAPVEAIRMFTMVMENFPADDLGYSARYEVALCHLRAKEYREARNLLASIVEGNPGHDILADAWFRLGSAEYLMGEYQNAARSYGRVLEVDPDGRLAREARFNLGLSLEKRNRWAEAAETYRTLLERFPEYEERDRVAFKVGYAFQEAERYDEAISAYERALPSASPEVGAEIQFWLGECYVRSRQTDKATLAFLKIGYLYPDQTLWAATGELRAAELYTRTGRPEEAVKLYRRVVERYGADSQWGRLASDKLADLDASANPVR